MRRGAPPTRALRARVRRVLEDPDRSVAREVAGRALTTVWHAKLALSIARLGDRIGSEFLSYNPLYMAWYHGHGLRFADRVMRAVDAQFPGVRRCLDVGSGTGVYAAALQRRGRDVDSCERSRVGRWIAATQGVRTVDFDLTREPPADLRPPFDLADCFEVAEHLPAPLGDRLVAFCASTAPLVVFTAAQPGQGGDGHVNEQPRDYWIRRFEAEGFAYRDAESEQLAHRLRAAGALWWLIENAMVFRRAS